MMCHSGAVSMSSLSSNEAMYEGSGNPLGTSYFFLDAAIFFSISAAALAFLLSLNSQKAYNEIASVPALRQSAKGNLDLIFNYINLSNSL